MITKSVHLTWCHGGACWKHTSAEEKRFSTRLWKSHVSLSPLSSCCGRLCRPQRISTHAEGGRFSVQSTSTSRVAIRTSLYITLVGIVGLVFPGFVIQCMVWLSKDSLQSMIPGMYIQLGGTLACLFGLYYAGAAFDDMQGRYPVGFYTSTVIGRYFLAIVFGLLYVMHGGLHTWVLLLGMVNALSAGLMQRAISRRE